MRLIPRLADRLVDHRDPVRTEHSVSELLALALGYEDLNDHDQLRSDPLLALPLVPGPINEDV